MNVFLNEINKLILELRSDKITIRNKAIELLDQKLTNSKSDLINLLKGKNPKNDDVSWIALFNSAIDATLKHAAKLEETNEKTFQTMVNKKHLFSSSVTKIIEYNLESSNHFLLKSTIFNAFEEGIRLRVVVDHFGLLFVNLLDRGIFKSEKYIRDLKLNEYSLILSYLFELNVSDDETLRLSILKLITKTIRIGIKRVQINSDLVDRLPELQAFARNAQDMRCKAEVISLLHIFITELMVDFHQKLCIELQTILPIITDFYNPRDMRNETKDLFFDVIYMSLHAIYPHIKKGNFNTMDVKLQESWQQTIKKLRTIVDVEIRNVTPARLHAKLLLQNKCSENFVNMAALIIYITNWHLQINCLRINENEDTVKSKISRPADTLETVINLIQVHDTTFVVIWFEIYTQLIKSCVTVLNAANIRDALNTAYNVLRIYDNANNLKNVRLCFESILKKEQQLCVKHEITKNYLDEMWTNIFDSIISELSTVAEIINEQQLILQLLIEHGKPSTLQCNTLLQHIMSNAMMKRNECVSTLKMMFIHSEQCGIDKASQEMENIIKWAFAKTEKINVTTAIYNITPIDAKLLADTFAIGVINFLNGDNHQTKEYNDERNPQTKHEKRLELLEYKYKSKLICLEFDKLLHAKHENTDIEHSPVRSGNCLFQNNYEVLMRSMNYETTKSTQRSDILIDLLSLHKISCLIERLLYYNVFNSDNYIYCPLIKRIGFFLSHLEFQLRSSDPRQFDAGDIFEILQQLEYVFTIFANNAVLLQYLETQPLEELINFVGITLKFSFTQGTNNEFGDWSKISSSCFCILSIICASKTYCKDALQHIERHNINITTEDVLKSIKILCNVKNMSEETAKWIVDKLKNIFRLLYTQIEIINTVVVEVFHKIIEHVYAFEELFDDMMIALNSLLKIAFRKSYSIFTTVKILESITLFTQRCCDICLKSNFLNICKSVAKFLTIDSVIVQFTTIRTLLALMSVNWISNNPIKSSAQHVYFCDELYEQINWKILPISTLDQQLNSNAVTMQMLVSFFVFSAFHQEAALQELVYFSALRKLTEDDFISFSSTVAYYKISLRELTRPFLERLIEKWVMKEYPILKFPFFISYENRDQFMNENISVILFSLLLYRNVDEVMRLKKYISNKNVFKDSLPIVHTYLLLYSVKCEETESSNYKKYVTNLQTNLINIKLLNQLKDNIVNVYTLYHMIKLLKDGTELCNLFGYIAIGAVSSEWYQIKMKTLLLSLQYYVCDEPTGNTEPQQLRLDTGSTLIRKHPLILVQLFGILKENCCNYLYTSEKIKQFFLYCVITEMIIDTAGTAELKSKEIKSYYKFLLRDIIFFLLNFLQTSRSCELQNVVLIFLHKQLKKPEMNTTLSNEILKTYLNEICKPLVLIAQKSTISTIRTLAIDIITDLITMRKDYLSDAIPLLDEFPVTEQFISLWELQREQSPKYATIQKFMETKNKRIGGLRALRPILSKQKAKIPDADLLSIFQYLIGIVRNSNKAENQLDAATCLGEIGPLQIKELLYYFQTDISETGENNSVCIEAPMQQFVIAMYETLEVHFLQLNANAQSALLNVAQLVVNCKNGKKLIAKYGNFEIFRMSSTNNANYLNNYDSIPSLDWLGILQSTENLQYEAWICAFMSKVFTHCGWESFAIYASKEYAFADKCLQPFVKLLLAKKDVHLTSLTKMLDYFFQQFCDIGVDGNNIIIDDNKILYKEKRAMGKMLNICEAIRINNNWEIPINLSNTVRASNHCQSYFLSIMYLELWAATAKDEDKSIFDDIYFQKCAQKAYESIGCFDAMASFVDPMKSRLDYLNLDNNWPEIMLEANSYPLDSDNKIYREALKRNGMLNVASHAQQQSKSATDYELFWRLGQWDMPVEGHSKLNTLNDMEHEFEKHHFMALKSIANREENNTISAINNAQLCIIAILREMSVDGLQNVYKYLTWLNMLQQADDFCKIQFSTGSDVLGIFQKWESELKLNYGTFTCKETILTHQIQLFRTAGVRTKRKILEFYKENPIESYLLQSITECKRAGKMDLAKRNIAALKAMPEIKDPTKLSVLLEDADICFKSGMPQITKTILEHVINNKKYVYCLQRIKATRMHGVYLMESNTERFDIVLRKNFEASLSLVDNFEKTKDKLMEKFQDIFKWSEFNSFVHKSRKEAYETIAKYADREYKRLDAYINSAEYQLRLNIIKNSRKSASMVDSKEARDTRIGAMNMQRFANLDEMELQLNEERRTEYLCTAVNYYFKYCIYDEGNSSKIIYRIIALWLANKHEEMLLHQIKNYIHEVPSYKFICALNQLTARLNSKNVEFRKILTQLLLRCADSHPHHTLYQLYSLVYGSYDDSAKSASTSSSDGNDNDDMRVQIAKSIIEKIRKGKHEECCIQLNKMFPALIEFANTDTPKGAKSVPLNGPLMRLRNLNAIHCPTVELSVQPNQTYKNIGIIKWEANAELVGGINVPKKLLCRCTDGKVRVQLLKGKDDLRQDAVMQQVFTLINDLLVNEPETAQRKLQLRTYKVMPLSKRSGILEWCENTIPIGNYLVEAHKKYRPKDYDCQKCRQLSANVLKADANKRYEVFKHITEHIKPVFHNFILEKFLNPGVWFERRLAYTNSVATTSIVGYMLGLGDRHTQNILIDAKTAEVIHIDFGIAFEQGRVMPTPETVPFRLTRDMVAPMGIAETDGVFTKASEATMHVLRRHKLVISTILEVLLYDPLYIWNVVPQLTADDEENTNEKTNLSAQRALIVVQNKLEGRETDTLSSADVEVQVQRLINEARSPRNLCMLFPGWDPYL